MLYRNKDVDEERSANKYQGSKDQKSTPGCCRVAHLHSTLGVYGAERWTYALLKNMDGRTFTSSVISIGVKDGADSFYKLLMSENLAAVHIPIAGKINLKLIDALRKVLKEQQIDILHTHGFKADVLGYIAARRIPLALVSTLHGWSHDEGMQIKLYEAIGRYFLKRFDCIYPNSPALAEGLMRQGFDPDKVKLILNAVDLSGFKYMHHIQQTNEPFRFIFVGRLCRPKGVFELIEAFAVAHFILPVELMIIGDGPEKAGLLELVESLGVSGMVKFTGAVKNVSNYMEKANALVLPSYSEGIPRVVMEAFAAGVPVIATNISGVRQLITNKINGHLVPVKDIQSLAVAMEYIQTHPDIALKYSKAARKTVVEKFSAQRMANDYKREYTKLLDRLAN